MNPLVFPCCGTRTKLDRKWQVARVSMGTCNAGVMVMPDGDLVRSFLDVGESSSCGEMGVIGSCPAFPILAVAPARFLFPLRARFSVALVSLRKTRSNSSLYPGHWRRDRRPAHGVSHHQGAMKRRAIGICWQCVSTPLHWQGPNDVH